MDILAIFETIVTYIYIPVAIVMVLIILLQAGKGGLGTALGGGASQSVFGGGGASEFMAKLTQGFAAAFMGSVLFLAYASAHSGSARLRDKSQELAGVEESDGGGEINYERIGPNPLPLPNAGSVDAQAIMPSDLAAPTDAEPEAESDAAAEAAGEAAGGETGEAAPAADAPADAPSDEAAPAGDAPAGDAPAGDAPAAPAEGTP